MSSGLWQSSFGVHKAVRHEFGGGELMKNILWWLRPGKPCPEETPPCTLTSSAAEQSPYEKWY